MIVRLLANNLNAPSSYHSQRYTDPLMLDLGCTLDGLVESCDTVMRLHRSGAGIVAPQQTIARVMLRYTDGTSQSFMGAANLPPGLDLTFTGYAAEAAGRGFDIGNFIYGFGGGVNVATVFGLAAQGNDGARGGVSLFSSSFAQTQNSNFLMGRFANFSQKEREALGGAFGFVTTYYVRSTVLGGQVVTELNEHGHERRSNIYANGAVLAKQADNQVQWEHTDPLTGSRRETSAAGNYRRNYTCHLAGAMINVTERAGALTATFVIMKMSYIP